jgi:hypothetical protein
MPKQDHEDLIDLARAIWFNHVTPVLGNFMAQPPSLFIIDHKLRDLAIEGLNLAGNWPDFYINLSDKHGPILGEVGEMESFRWGHLICSDGKPVRVLRIGFDFSVGIINPRFTRREVKLVKIYQEYLFRVRGAVIGA